VYDVVELPGGAPAIVMELLAGHSLQRRFDQGPMPVGDLCHVLGRVAAAVGAAHAAGIIHRDLKPENVFLASGAGGGVEVKVLDFGVAKRTALASPQSSGDLTRTGALVGTPFYMSPEQALGDDDVDGRADIWALGLMLYEGLSGVLPTRADNLGRVIKAVAMTPIAPIDRLVPAVPRALAELLGRMLSKSRDGRPGAMDDVRVVLARHESAMVEARPDLDVALPSGAGAPIVGSSEVRVFAPSTSFPDASPRARARRAVTAALAATALLGAGGLAVVAASGPRARDSVAPAVTQSSAPILAPPAVLLVPAAAAASASSGPPPVAVAAAHPAPRGDSRGRSPAALPSAQSPAPSPSASSGIGVEREF
jgi:serine/threonine-protein kinase